MGYLFAAFYFALAGTIVMSAYFVSPQHVQREVRDFLQNISA